VAGLAVGLREGRFDPEAESGREVLIEVGPPGANGLNRLREDSTLAGRGLRPTDPGAQTKHESLNFLRLVSGSRAAALAW
jgi:hypothetical protein